LLLQKTNNNHPNINLGVISITDDISILKLITSIFFDKKWSFIIPVLLYSLIGQFHKPFYGHFGKASLVGTNSVWGSVVSAKEIFSPESVNKFAKVERSLSIFINSIVLYSLVLSTPLRIGPSTWAKNA
jgi:hypothetical protein